MFYGLLNNIKLGLIVKFLTLLLEGPSNYSLVNETSFLQIWTTESRVGAVWRVDPLSGRQATCSASANPAPALHWQNRKFAKNCTTISKRFLTSISIPESTISAELSLNENLFECKTRDGHRAGFFLCFSTQARNPGFWVENSRLWVSG